MANLPAPSELHKRLIYHPETGHFYWRELPLDLFHTVAACREWNKRYAGKRAGSVKRLLGGVRYRYIYLNRKNVSEHRIAWAMMTNNIPPKMIDHKNRDGLDNRWLNLRDGTSMNPWNRSKQRNNSSGVTGVGFHKKARKWEAHVRFRGKKLYLGLHSDIKDAERIVIAKRRELGFDTSHGI